MKTRPVLPGVILIAAIPPAFASDVSSSQGSKMGQTMQGMPMHRNMPCVQRWLHDEDRETPSHSVNLDPNRFHSSCGPFSRRRRPEVLAGVVWQCAVAVAVHQVANQSALSVGARRYRPPFISAPTWVARILVSALRSRRGWWAGSHGVLQRPGSGRRARGRWPWGFG